MSTNSPPTSISFKVRYGTDLRRFRLPTATLTYPILLQTLMTAFNVDHRVRVTYKDEEGDEVLIGSTRELQAALIPPPTLLHLTLTTYDKLDESMILVEHIHASPTPSTLEATQDAIHEINLNDGNDDKQQVRPLTTSTSTASTASTSTSTPIPTLTSTSIPTLTATTLATTVATSEPINVLTCTSITPSPSSIVNDEKHGSISPSPSHMESKQSSSIHGDECYLIASQCDVYQQDSDAWAVTLYQTNVGDTPNHKYYTIQLLQHTSTGEYYVWHRWGRVGTIGGQFLLKCDNNLNHAKQEFCRKFQDKTKNDWFNKAHFIPYPGKYALLEYDRPFVHRQDITPDDAMKHALTLTTCAQEAPPVLHQSDNPDIDEKHGTPIIPLQDQQIDNKTISTNVDIPVTLTSVDPAPLSSPQAQTLVPASFDLTASSSWTTSPSQIGLSPSRPQLDISEPLPPQSIQLPADVAVVAASSPSRPEPMQLPVDIPVVATSSPSPPISTPPTVSISSPTVSLPIPVASPTASLPVTAPTLTSNTSSFSWFVDRVRGLFSNDSKTSDMIPDDAGYAKIREHIRLKLQVMGMMELPGSYYFNGEDITKIISTPDGSWTNYFDCSEVDSRANRVLIYYPPNQEHINLLYGQKGFAYAICDPIPWPATRQEMMKQFPDSDMEFYYRNPSFIFNQLKPHLPGTSFLPTIPSTTVTSPVPEPIVVPAPVVVETPVASSSSSISIPLSPDDPKATVIPSTISIPLSPDDPEEAAIQAALERSQYLNHEEKQQHIESKEESMSLREFIEQDHINLIQTQPITSPIVTQLLNQLTAAITPDLTQLITASQTDIHTDITPFTINPHAFSFTRDALLADVSRIIKHHREQYMMILQQQEQARVDAEMKLQAEVEAKRVEEAELAGIAAAAAAQAFAQEAEAKRIAQQQQQQQQQQQHQQAPIIDVLPETPEQAARRAEEEIRVRLLALEQMGFSNTALNRRLLRTNNNNLGDCIEWLLTNNAVELGPISPSNQIGPM